MADRGSDPAYPVDVVREYKAAGEGHHRTVVGTKGGMTIRERFVMAAMEGLCANPKATEEFYQEDIARRAIRMADIQLAALASEGGDDDVAV